jgi:hypothetical protein
MLTLKEAIQQKRLSEFVAQEEARGVKAADKETLERLLKRASKPRLSRDRTSHSSYDGGSTEK